MRVDQILSSVTRRAMADGVTVCHAGHRHALPSLSRRRFMKATAGATVFGAVAGPALLTGVAQAAGPGIGLALPIPATLDLLGEDFHVQAPPTFTPVDTDPATVNNFQGACGIAFISGTVERTNRRTGETQVLPYLFNDMRFMKGVFRGRDGHERNATFGFL